MTKLPMHARIIVCRRHLIFLIICFTIVPVTLVVAQDDHYERIFTTENGLPHNNVLSLTTDKTGFLWIGTWDGLSRYDGYEFHNYFHDPEDSTSIPFFTVKRICVDKFNNVWIFPLANLLSRYVRATDNFCNYTPETDSALKQTRIYDIQLDTKGNLLVVGVLGISRFDSASGTFIRIPIVDRFEEPLNMSELSTISFDNTGKIWLTTISSHIMGIYDNNEKNPVIKVSAIYPYMTDDFFPRPNGFHRTFEFASFPDSSIWFFSNAGLKKVPENELSVSHPYEFDPAGKNFYWYGKNNSIQILSAENHISIKLDTTETPQSVFVDQYGTVWYSTLLSSGMGTGLHRYNRTPGYFRHYLPDINGIPAVVYSIIKDNRGNILVGTESNNFITCVRKDGGLDRLNVLSKEDALNSTHVRSMIPFLNGIMIGYIRERLDFYDFTTEKFTNLSITNDPTRQKEPFGFRTLFNDGGHLLIGTLGLFLYTPEKDQKFEKIWQSNPPGKGFFSMRADSKGIIWAGSGRLLLKLTRDYKVDTIYTISHTEYNVEDLSFDENGKVWLALLGGGLEHFDPATGQREFYTTSDGLSNNTTYSILRDRHNNLWITTDNGISRFNTRTKKFRIFGQTDGLRIHEFNSDAAFLDKDGQMFFGGMGGVVSFYPDSIMDSETGEGKSPLVITEFRVSGVPRHFDRPVYESTNVTLNRGDDNFGVTFVCMNFKNAEKIKYRYRISGYSDDWIEADYLHRRINIAGLRPDTYTLEIESTDIFGEWNNGMKLYITIPPQFHQTVGFMLLMILLGLGIILILVVLNNRQIRIKEKQKQQYLKLESIRGQMNPHFIFNSLNSINYFIANNERLAANRYIANFSKLIRSFLSNMSQEYISLKDEIASIQDYLRLEFLRFGDKFDYSLNAEQIQNIEMWEVFPGMVQPFIENAIWHGVRGLLDRKGSINIAFSENQSGGILCTVTDDGIGRKLSAGMGLFPERKKSRGIGLIMERMQLINHLENKQYTVHIDDLFHEKEECGTRIIIAIPSRKKFN